MKLISHFNNQIRKLFNPYYILNDEKAVTLSEVLVYLAVFGIIFTTIIGFSMSVSENNRKNRARVSIEKSLLFIDEQLGETISSATSIDESKSTFDNDSGILYLSTSEGFVEYKILNGRLDINENGNGSYLTDFSNTVESFLLEKILNESDQIIGVRVTLLMRSNQNSSILSDFTISYLVGQ